MEDRRRYPRYDSPNNKFCSVRCEGDTDFSGNIMNLSRKGIAFSTLKPLENSSVVSLNLTYPEALDRSIASKVEIVWRAESNVLHAYGARFLDIQADDKTDLLDMFYEHWKERVLKDKKLAFGSRKKWIAETR